MTIKSLHIAILLAFLLVGGVTAVDLDWTETNSSAFPVRYEHAACSFDGKLWVSGGYNGTSYLNDVWYSTDGVTWTCANASAGFNARAGHAMEALGSYMYVIGGYNGTAAPDNTYPAMYDVYRSSDGDVWTLVNNSPEWKGTYAYYGTDYGLAYMGSMVGDGKIWITGGYQYRQFTGTYDYSDDVWYSTDGDIWTDAGNCPDYNYGGYNSDGWERHRNEWMSVAFVGGKFMRSGIGSSMYPTGGTAYSSYDGSVWTTRTTSAYWTPRSDFGMVYYDSSLILFGGYASDSLYKRDVWYSEDEGTTWTQYSDADWSIRKGLTSTEFDNKIWITGGYGPTGALADVWSGEINATATSEYASDSMGAGYQYPPHSVRFTFIDSTGRPITGATITAIPIETSLGAWGWITDVFGFNEDVDLGGSTLTGTTGSDGTISFMMIEQIRYNVTVVKASASINQTISVFPKESEYFLRIGVLPQAVNFPDYNLTITDVNSSYVRLAMNYDDSNNDTTSVNFYVYNETGTQVYTTPVSLTGGAGTAYYDVENTRGTGYKFGFNGTNGYHGNVSAYQGVDMKGSGPLIDYGWPTIYYSIISIAVIFLIGGAMGEMDVRTGAIIVPIFAGLFWYIGWLPASLGAILGVVFPLGILYYMRGSLKAVDT